MKILIVLQDDWSYNMVKLRHLWQTNRLTLLLILSEVSTVDVMKKLEKRNNETTVSDARARYLQRKQQRQQSKALWQTDFEDMIHTMYHKGAFSGNDMWIINICYIYNTASLFFNPSTYTEAFMGLCQGSHANQIGAFLLSSEEIERKLLA